MDEVTNDDRAAWAATAIAAFIDGCGGEEDEALSDLLCNLMHWADRADFDFNMALDQARSTYKAEKSDERLRFKPWAR